MALITDLPTNPSPSTSDYLVTDDGSTTYKLTVASLPISHLRPYRTATSTTTGQFTNFISTSLTGIHFVLVTYSEDTTAYYVGLVVRTASNHMYVTTLQNNLITLSASNAYGTMAFNYNGGGATLTGKDFYLG